jgi:hypothetical protein
VQVWVGSVSGSDVFVTPWTPQPVQF